MHLPRLFAAWIPDHGPREIRRALTAEEIIALNDRASELRAGLAPHSPEDQDSVKASLAAMFSGFRSMRQTGEDVEATIAITRAILRDFPAWAIAEACLNIARQDREWPPNDGQICAAVERVVAPYRDRLKTCEALLAAPVEQQPPERKPYVPVPRETPDGQHAQRVMADMERRKAEGEAA